MSFGDPYCASPSQVPATYLGDAYPSSYAPGMHMHIAPQHAYPPQTGMPVMPVMSGMPQSACNDPCMQRQHSLRPPAEKVCTANRKSLAFINGAGNLACSAITSASGVIRTGEACKPEEAVKVPKPVKWGAKAAVKTTACGAKITGKVVGGAMHIVMGAGKGVARSVMPADGPDGPSQAKKDGKGIVASLCEVITCADEQLERAMCAAVEESGHCVGHHCGGDAAALALDVGRTGKNVVNAKGNLKALKPGKMAKKVGKEVGKDVAKAHWEAQRAALKSGSAAPGVAHNPAGPVPGSYVKGGSAGSY